ncbi:MAG: hypothetical protein ACLTER_11130 [Ruminococcus sp.]
MFKKYYFMGAGVEAEDPIKLSLGTFLFYSLLFMLGTLLTFILEIAETPYSWVLSEDLPPLEFADFSSVTDRNHLASRANGAAAPDYPNPCPDFSLELYQAAF